jgi:hypothetical protein
MGKSINEFCGVNAFNEKPNGEKMSHEEKYTMVVNAIGLERCIQYLPATKEEIQKALKEDEYLNNIPLHKWEGMHPLFKWEFIRIGITILSLSATVSTLKRAARMYAETE